MIIWLNGAFGSGKTQTSYELERRIPNSHVYDPENIGYFINRNIPKEISKGDFQDYSIWRELNYTTLKYIDRAYDGMTVNHFVLWASKETLQKRLRSRGGEKIHWVKNK